MLIDIVRWLDQQVLPALLASDTPDGCVLDPPPCRVAVYPGQEVAFDVCSQTATANGQLWASVQLVQNNNPTSPRCERLVWTGQIGITRCAAGPGNDGSPPPAAEVIADAYQQAADADVIAKMLRCCLPDPPSGEMEVDLINWTPISPQGGCVGGYWTVSGAYYLCC